MALPERIRIIRQKSFLSQEDFAKTLNVSLSTVNRWETGKTRPNLSAMKAIKKFCQANQIGFNELEVEWLNNEHFINNDSEEK